MVLDVLNRKSSDIDAELSLLHELREIVLRFIRQIKETDFANAMDVRHLYEQAKEIENRITHIDYAKPSNG